eukprot:COSAG06_NODE_864_length_11873_cov_16.077374_2_plen_842_part_00
MSTTVNEDGIDVVTLSDSDDNAGPAGPNISVEEPDAMTSPSLPSESDDNDEDDDDDDESDGRVQLVLARRHAKIQGYPTKDDSPTKDLAAEKEAERIKKEKEDAERRRLEAARSLLQQAEAARDTVRFRHLSQSCLNELKPGRPASPPIPEEKCSQGRVRVRFYNNTPDDVDLYFMKQGVPKKMFDIRSGNKSGSFAMQGSAFHAKTVDGSKTYGPWTVVHGEEKQVYFLNDLEIARPTVAQQWSSVDEEDYVLIEELEPAPDRSGTGWTCSEELRASVSLVLPKMRQELPEPELQSEPEQAELLLQKPEAHLEACAEPEGKMRTRPPALTVPESEEVDAEPMRETEPVAQPDSPAVTPPRRSWESQEGPFPSQKENDGDKVLGLAAMLREISSTSDHHNECNRYEEDPAGDRASSTASPKKEWPAGEGGTSSGCAWQAADYEEALAKLHAEMKLNEARQDGVRLVLSEPDIQAARVSHSSYEERKKLLRKEQRASRRLEATRAPVQSDRGDWRKMLFTSRRQHAIVHKTEVTPRSQALAVQSRGIVPRGASDMFGPQSAGTWDPNLDPASLPLQSRPRTRVIHPVPEVVRLWEGGDECRVFSNGVQAWCPGIVKRADSHEIEVTYYRQGHPVELKKVLTREQATRELRDVDNMTGLSLERSQCLHPKAEATTPEAQLQAHPLNPPGRWAAMISYTQRNPVSEALAYAIQNELEKRGHSVWLDVKMGARDEAAMEEGVKNSQCVIAIVSGPQPGQPADTAYFRRPFCLKELRWALEAQVAVVPVVVYEDKGRITELMADVPDDLGHLRGTNWEHIDRKDVDYFELGVTKIIGAAEKGGAQL